MNISDNPETVREADIRAEQNVPQIATQELRTFNTYTKSCEFVPQISEQSQSYGVNTVLIFC